MGERWAMKTTMYSSSFRRISIDDVSASIVSWLRTERMVWSASTGESEHAPNEPSAVVDVPSDALLHVDVDEHEQDEIEDDHGDVEDVEGQEHELDLFQPAVEGRVPVLVRCTATSTHC